METLWVDFQNAGQDGVRLNCNGTLKEISEKSIHLYDGLCVTIWSEDQNDNDEPDNLIVEAVVKYSHTEKVWVAQFDWNDLKNESELK